MKILNILSNFKNSNDNEKFVFYHFIGGETNVDVCQGDGGGPLVCPIGNNRYVQTGAIAWGIACNLDIPGVYMNVAYFRDWIDYNVRNHGFETSTYTV
jgi:secreted trypsin-like serine protease